MKRENLLSENLRGRIYLIIRNKKDFTKVRDNKIENVEGKIPKT